MSLRSDFVDRTAHVTVCERGGKQTVDYHGHKLTVTRDRNGRIRLRVGEEDFVVVAEDLEIAIRVCLL